MASLDQADFECTFSRCMSYLIGELPPQNVWRKVQK